MAQVSKTEADSAYAAEDFARAAQLYRQILDKEGESAEDDLAKALWYEEYLIEKLGGGE